MKHLKKWNHLDENKGELGSIPKAAEFFESIVGEKPEEFNSSITSAMIEFAKLHVKAALQAAADDYSEGPSEVVEKLILKAYPLKNIK